MVRDEDDVIESVIRHMAKNVDAIVVADNMSTDLTRDILQVTQAVLGIPITILDDTEVGYTQSAKMTRLAGIAREQHNADWIVPFDADEIWYSPQERIADFLEARPANEMVVPANLYDHVCTGLDDPSVKDPVRRLEWRRDYSAPLPKVACRWRKDMVIGMGNHDVAYRDNVGTSEHRMAIRHFPYRSPEQIVRKVRNGAEAYAATKLPAHFGAHWRQWGAILNNQGPDAIIDLFHKWYWREHPGDSLDIDGELQPPLMRDPAPVFPTKPEEHEQHQD
jgi:glycosyltransferase involved in cell wall biosynthesis